MATLEKIRSKSVLLLIIVGAALLAFIIGDFFTSGRTLFGTGTTIAKVGSQKVDVQEFQRRVQQAQQQQQQQGRQTNTDPAVLQQQVLQDMIAEKLFDEEISKLGLTVTDAELTEMMVGKNSAYVDRMIQQQLGLPDAATAHDMAYNPTKYNLPQEQALQLQQYWVELEQNVEKMLLQQKFQNLFAGTLTANELDARAMYDEMAETASVLYAKKDLSTVSDEGIEVTAADIDKLYASEKNKYRLMEPTRLVNYISVNIIPSNADQMAGQKAVEDALVALNSSADATLSDLFVVENQKLSQADVDRQARLKQLLDTLAPGNAALVSRSGNDYQLARLNGKSSAADKVKLDFLAVQGSKAQVDSLVAVLNSGVAFDSVATSPLVAQSQKETEYSLLDGNAAVINELIEGRATGVWFTPDTLAQGGRIVRVAERATPVTIYDLTLANYTVEPSNATINELESDLQNYVATHKTATQFVDSAQAAGFTTFPAYVSASTPNVGNLNDTHSAVAWAMDAKKGEVSPVFGDIQSGRFVAVAVDDIYDDFRPARDPQVNAALNARVLSQKKADKVLADINGKAKDVAGYAAVMGVQADTTTVNFAQMMVPGIGMNESAIQGRVAAAKAGDFIAPMKGNSSVVVMQVLNIDNEGRPYTYDESAMRYDRQRGASRLANNLPVILIGKQAIKNNMNKFYR